MRVREIHFETHSMKLEDEEAIYKEDLRQIIIYEDGCPVEFINVNYVKSFTVLTTHYPQLTHSKASPSPKVEPKPTLLATMCTCEDEPDPSCPTHGPSFPRE